MDALAQHIRDTLLQAARDVYQPEQPVATCPECRCDLYEGDGPCGETGCPILPFPARAAA